MTNSKNVFTQCIHSGNWDDIYGAAISPLYDTSTFAFSNTDDLLQAVDGNHGAALYSRYGSNPTIQSLEQRMADLEQGEEGLAYASGMAAITSLFLTYGRDGIICVGEIYGGTRHFLQNLAPSLGIHTQFVDSDDKDSLESSLKKGCSLVFFETPSNPTLKVIDIALTSAISHRYSAKVAIDNTFATPINQQPLTHGADFSVQSATKFLGGHSDLTAGVLVGPKSELSLLKDWRNTLGQTIGAEVAHKLKRSLTTLPLRVERHNLNAQKVAEFLEQHEAVGEVFYPGLLNSPSHAMAKKQMHGYGGMLSFNITDGEAVARQVADNFNLIKLAPSLGGVETLATQPVTTSHHGLSADLLQQMGITGAMIRLSVGLESPDDIIADLEHALSKSYYNRN